MPPSANQDPAAPSVPATWLEFATGHARSLRKLVAPNPDGLSRQAKTSAKARQQARRPVWE